jgi:hypothetical protein
MCIITTRKTRGMYWSFSNKNQTSYNKLRVEPLKSFDAKFFYLQWQ